ncbi:MAG: dTMP kinase [Thermoplasmata archaeon]|nr:dTMP kinase [Thermoplasmata archaeon]MCI4359622.1 dTMP kinase [Thermoplasmata archaeon]
MIPETPSPTHGYPGRLLVFEGLDGSGKSTQARLIGKWLQSRGYRVFFTEWNSSDLVASTIRRGKKKGLLTATTFSLLHATDFADRFERQILPPLRAGYVVICDRYVYTAFVRDAARGCDPNWVRNIYSFAPRPDRTFYFQVPVQVTLDRKIASRSKISYYEAGMDLGLADDVTESFERFQGRLKRQYDLLATSDHFTLIDAGRPVEPVQNQLRRELRPLLERFPTVESLIHDG